MQTLVISCTVSEILSQIDCDLESDKKVRYDVCYNVRHDVKIYGFLSHDVKKCLMTSKSMESTT